MVGRIDKSQVNRKCVKQSFCMITLKVWTCIIVLHPFAQISNDMNKESENCTIESLSAKQFYTWYDFCF